MTREDIGEINDKALFLEEKEMDEAILGIAQSFGKEPIVAYSVPKILNVLMTRDGMSYDDADEFFQFNILGSYNGECMPVFIYTD